MLYPSNGSGFTLIELSVVLLILTVLASSIYPVAIKRLMISDIDNSVREAQVIANYGESIRTRWLSSTSIDPVTEIYSHVYRDTKIIQAGGGGSMYYTVDMLPFEADQMLPENNFTGLPYQIAILDDFAHVRTVLEYADPAVQADILEQLQNHPLVADSQIDPNGVAFIVIGKPNDAQLVSQVKKTKFDKAFLYLETVR